MNAETKKRGRPAMVPPFLAVINSTPEGEPVVLQAQATTPALAYHHRRNLAKSGVMAEVVAPGKQKQIGNAVVNNSSEFYALVAVGTDTNAVSTNSVDANLQSNQAAVTASI